MRRNNYYLSGSISNITYLFLAAKPKRVQKRKNHRQIRYIRLYSFQHAPSIACSAPLLELQGRELDWSTFTFGRYSPEANWNRYSFQDTICLTLPSNNVISVPCYSFWQDRDTRIILFNLLQKVRSCFQAIRGVLFSYSKGLLFGCLYKCCCCVDLSVVTTARVQSIKSMQLGDTSWTE